MIKYTGNIIQANKTTALQFFRNTEGDFLSIHSEDGRLIIIPVEKVQEALEGQWEVDALERAKRVG